MDINEEEIPEHHVINACTMGQLEIVNDYFESRNVNEFFHSGWTALLYAASSAQINIIEYLISKGADVNIHKDGYTSLMALCNSTRGTTEQRIKCLKLLITAEADADASNKQRQTALMYACISQEPDFVSELLKYVRNINACDNRRQTALMYATIANKPEIVKILMENAADITMTDYNDLTAIDMASIKGYDEILSLLNFNEEEAISTFETVKIQDWKDMFPTLTDIDDNAINFDIYTILYGMNLEKYTHLFQGLNLRTFLKLSENNLCDLGLDINAHRIQFMEHLHKFHRKKWSIQSIGVINKSLPYTLYNGIVNLGTVAKQIAIIGSSFQYVKNCLIQANKDMPLTEEQISNYEQELKKTQKCLSILEKELKQVKALSKRIQKENDIDIPATYISSKNCKINWPMYLSITLIIGIYVSKTMYIQNLIHY
ncbi:uncharacterized protein LOC143422502 isoform X1 [Xylocopa sonorina]|uniref:uncharacterized protein LOC143422502 isoform X1 n=2 Tax=Xylocopa sonorina TaxID=1818115 RepID=UPI00403A8DB5